MRFALKRGPETLVLEVAGRPVSVSVRRNPRARRLILRIDAASGLPAMTLPARTSHAQAEAFLSRHAGWLEARLGRAAAGTPLRDGAAFPLRGAACRIHHRGGRGLVRLETAGAALLLSVPGEPAHLPRRVTDWLKREARRDLATAVERYGAQLGKSPKLLRIGDTKSRWGSCTAQGVLSFSWRLVLAPPNVLEYLAAHEVAHLAEMNHGPDFWRLVGRLNPGHAAARAWLKANGPGLHAIGREA